MLKPGMGMAVVAMVGCMHAAPMEAEMPVAMAFDDALDAVRAGARSMAEAGGYVVERLGEAGLQVYRAGREKVSGATSNLSDAYLTSQVKARLVADSMTSARNIAVATDAGVVTLRGEVSDRHEAAAAIRDALAIEGVASVNSEIVWPSSSPKQ